MTVLNVRSKQLEYLYICYAIFSNFSFKGTSLSFLLERMNKILKYSHLSH